MVKNVVVTAANDAYFNPESSNFFTLYISSHRNLVHPVFLNRHAPGHYRPGQHHL